jgi:hypothetical protein
MFYKKINDTKYIIPMNAITGVEAIVSALNKKRERLIEKQQIEEEIDVMSVKFQAVSGKNIASVQSKLSNPLQQTMLMKNPRDYVVADFNMLPININKWEVLGLIELIQDGGEYTLRSYTNKDMPKKYRDLEDPCMCEHCNTNRKRNQTFVIQNTETAEILQVGSSCMDDYITKDDLSFLLQYTSVMKKVEEELAQPKSRKTVTLFNKNELIATMIAVQEDHDLGYHGMNEVLDVYNIEGLKKAFELNGENRLTKSKYQTASRLVPTDKHRDMADDVLDWYEDLNVEKYNDDVFNHSNILNSDTDFLLLKEVYKLRNTLQIKETITNKNNQYSKLLADYIYGVEIGENERITYDNKDLYYASKLSKEEFGFVSPQENNSLNTSTYIMQIINPERLIDDIENPNHIDIRSSVEKLNAIWKDHKSSGKVNAYFAELERFSEHAVSSKNNFERWVAQEIMDSDKWGNENLDDKIRKMIWADKLLGEFQVKDKELKITNKTDELGLTGRIFDEKGESFEEWELQLKSRVYNHSDMYGGWYETRFEDRKGNIITYSGNKEVSGDNQEFTADWMDENVDKWLSIKGKFKEYDKTAYINQKKTPVLRINYVSMVGEFKNEPTTDGQPKMTEKGKKYTIGQYTIIDKEEFEHKGLSYDIYKLNDSHGEDYLITTTDTLDLKTNENYQIAHMGKNKMKNIQLEYIRNIPSLEQDAFQLTKAQTNKEFGIKVANKKKM